MNYLLVNDKIWMQKSPSFFIPVNATSIIIDVTDAQLRPLEHYMPGVGIRLIDWHVLQTKPKPFELSLAVGKSANVVSKFIAIVDELHPAWEEFCNSGPAPNDEPVIRELPLNLDLLWRRYENLCL